MRLTGDTQTVLKVFDGFPEPVRTKLLFLRDLIFETAKEISDTDKVVETLKWGEPSYLTDHGSTIRLGYIKNMPQHYGLFFHCQTSLVETFREVYSDVFQFEGNRAIIFHVNDPVPVTEVKNCISLSLVYHRVKHLPLLGL